MMYQLLQDAHQSTALGARATNLLAAQARVARAARELRDAVAAEEKAMNAYEHVRGGGCATCGWSGPQTQYVGEARIEVTHPSGPHEKDWMPRMLARTHPSEPESP